MAAPSRRPASGTIVYELPGTNTWVTLNGNTALPSGTLIDATNGAVQVTNPEAGGQTQSLTLTGGEFTVEPRLRRQHHDPRTGPLQRHQRHRPGCLRASAKTKKKATNAKRVTGSLWAKGHGKFTTKGSYGAASVLGTEWLTRNTAGRDAVRGGQEPLRHRRRGARHRRLPASPHGGAAPGSEPARSPPPCASPSSRRRPSRTGRHRRPHQRRRRQLRRPCRSRCRAEPGRRRLRRQGRWHLQGRGGQQDQAPTTSTRRSHRSRLPAARPRSTPTGPRAACRAGTSTST